MGPPKQFDQEMFRLIKHTNEQFKPGSLKFYSRYCLQILIEDLLKVMGEMEMGPTETFDNNATLLFTFENGEDELVSGKVDFCEDDLGR